MNLKIFFKIKKKINQDKKNDVHSYSFKIDEHQIGIIVIQKDNNIEGCENGVNNNNTKDDIIITITKENNI